MALLKARGIVPLPAFGSGAYLRFSNADLAAFEDSTGPAWFREIASSIEQAVGDPMHVPLVMVRKLLAAGGYIEDEHGIRRLPQHEIDDVVPREVYRPILDALSAAVAGMTWDEYVADIQKRAAALEEQIRKAEAANPQNPEASLPGSAGEPSGPA